MTLGSRACTFGLPTNSMKSQPRRTRVNDKMQQGYECLLTKPTGKDFAPGFKPQLTPEQMLRLGVFGGGYMTDGKAECPRDWFAKAKLCPERHNPKLNYFGINASQPLSVWHAKGWIYQDDPRGWFQWYCFSSRPGWRSKWHTWRRLLPPAVPESWLDIRAGQRRRFHRS